MPSKNIKVPRHLKQRMSEHREINWTEVMRNAAYEHLDKVEKKPDLIQQEAPVVEDKNALVSLFGNMNSKTRPYLIGGIFAFILLLTLWDYLWIIGLIALLVYLVYKRRQPNKA